MRNLDHVGNLESLLDELGYMQYICVCVWGGGGGGGGVDVEVIGEVEKVGNVRFVAVVGGVDGI